MEKIEDMKKFRRTVSDFIDAVFERRIREEIESRGIDLEKSTTKILDRFIMTNKYGYEIVESCITPSDECVTIQDEFKEYQRELAYKREQFLNENERLKDNALF